MDLRAKSRRKRRLRFEAPRCGSVCGTASALPKCSIMSRCGTRFVLRGQKPLALCDRCPCFGSLYPPLAALTFAASSIICAFGLASAAPRSPYRHLELCGIALNFDYGLLAVYFCGLHRILFKVNSPYGKAKFGSFLFWCALRSFFPLTCFPSIPVAITVILHFHFCVR